MPKYKQVWTWYTYIFVPCIWLAQNYMKILFRNISSAKLKWKVCTRRITYDCFFSVLWLTQVGYFILNFPWLIFLVVFSANYCHYCLISLKNHKIVVSLSFALQVICFTTCIMTKVLGRVTRITSFPLRNQYWMQKFFKPSM